MIKANDLRIGNWIYLLDEYLQINIDNFQMVADGFGEYNGIPLTPEILEKAGFVEKEDSSGIFYENKRGDRVYLWAGGFEYEYTTKGGRFNLFRTFIHLHQLQNLYYALTGEELEINL